MAIKQLSALTARATLLTTDRLAVWPVGSDVPQRATLGISRALSPERVPHTGNTTETTLATVNIPAGAMGTTGAVRITSLWSYTDSANIKTPRVKFGGVTYYASGSTTTKGIRLQQEIHNLTVNSQVGASSTSPGFSTSTGAIVNSAVNTAAAVAVTFTAQLALATEEMALEYYLIETFYGA